MPGIGSFTRIIFRIFLHAAGVLPVVVGCGARAPVVRERGRTGSTGTRMGLLASAPCPAGRGPRSWKDLRLVPSRDSRGSHTRASGKPFRYEQKGQGYTGGDKGRSLLERAVCVEGFVPALTTGCLSTGCCLQKKEATTQGTTGQKQETDGRSMVDEVAHMQENTRW